MDGGSKTKAKAARTDGGSNNHNNNNNNHNNNHTNNNNTMDIKGLGNKKVEDIKEGGKAEAERADGDRQSVVSR